MPWEEAVEDSECFCFTFLLFIFHQGHHVSYSGFGSLAGAFKKMLLASFLSGKNAVQSQLKLPENLDEIHLGLS